MNEQEVAELAAGPLAEKAWRALLEALGIAEAMTMSVPLRLEVVRWEVEEMQGKGIVGRAGKESQRPGLVSGMYDALMVIAEGDDSQAGAAAWMAIEHVAPAQLAAMDAAVEALDAKHPEESAWPLTFARDGTCLLLRDRQEASFSLHPAEEAQLLRELLRRHIEREQRASAAKRALRS